MNDRMREAKRKIQLVALCLSTKAHAHQRELLLEAFADAVDQVVDQCADGAGHRVGFAALIGRGEGQRVVFILHKDLTGQRKGQRTLRAFDRDLVGCYRDFNARRQRDRHLTYS